MSEHEHKQKRHGYTLSHPLDDLYGKKSIHTRPVQLTRAHKQSAGKKMLIVLLALGFFSAVAWLGFFFFSGKPSFNDKHIALSIDTPKDISSGDNISFTIHYQNNQDATLNETELRVKPPEGFLLESTEPKSNGTNEYHFKLGKLLKNEAGKIIINGTFFGIKEGNHTINAYFSYRPENFNADFEKIASAQLQVQSSPLELSLSAPDDIAAGAQAVFSLSLKNNSENELGPIALLATLPEQFIVATSTPPLINNKLNITSIKPQEEWHGSIEGTYKNSAQGEHQVLFDTYIVVKKKEYLQNQIKHFMSVNAPELEAHLSVNDFEKKGSVAPGQSLAIQSKVKNSGAHAVSSVAITLEIESPAEKGKSIINWDALLKEIEDAKKSKKPNEKIPPLELTLLDISPKRQRATIVWNEKTTPALASMEKDAEVVESLSLPIFTPKEFGNTLPGNTIIINMNVSSNGGAPTHTAPYEVILRSDTTLSVDTQPASDPLVGIGPDGLTEVSVRGHDILITIQNNLHEITDLEIIATIPEQVAYEKSLEIPAGEIQYIKAKRTVRWILNKLPTSVPSLPFSFRLDTITPIGDAETSTLISDITLTAIDGISGEPFKIKLGPVMKK